MENVFDLELAQLQLADLQAGLAAIGSRQAVQVKQFSKQKTEFEKRISQLQSQIAEESQP